MEPVRTPRVFSGRYEQTHLIARGGMAQVYRAHDRLLDRPVALKVLFPELSVDHAFVERFRREAQAAANLSHPNIVPVFDWGEDDGTYFIVMEFVDGRPLSALLRTSGSLAPSRAAAIGADVAAALSYAHRHGVVHRDVKPGNVLITDDGVVKVTDFGIARAVNTEDSLTQTGAVMGTAAYFSPEQAEGAGVDSRSDIYSLGVVLFEMVAGRAPFTGDSPVAVASKHVREQPPRLSELDPQVPSALEAVIAKSMAKAADQRYLSADELRADLLRFADGRPVLADDMAMAAAPATVGQSALGTTRVIGGIGGGPPSTGTTRAVPVLDGAPPQEDADDQARRRRKRRLLLAILLLVAAVAAVTVLLLRSLGYLGGGLNVPNVVGKPIAAAESTLRGDGLMVGTVTHETSARPDGVVVATDPSTGSAVNSGDRINLVVSSGAPQVQVRDVQRLDLATAEGLLTNDGLRFKVDRTQPTTGQSAGTVLSQNPLPGSKVASGTTVDLVVAVAPGMVQVPDVTGEGAATAGSNLKAAGLSVGSTTNACSSSGVASGLVSSTSPAPGTTQALNAPVNLVVSSGPCATVPGVVGQPQQQATSAITASHLNPVAQTTTSCTPDQNGTVTTQSPGPGAPNVSPGSTVTLTVCNAPTTTTTQPTTTTTS